MIEFLSRLPLVYIALICSFFTWFVTALGSASVFLFKSINKKALNTMLGFASGVMIAASFWSLLSPAIELSVNLGYIAWLFPAIGLLIGGTAVVAAGKLLDKFSFINKNSFSKTKKRSFLLVCSVTIHNIPEGLCVGVAFGAVALNIPSATVTGSILLALGIALQNFPEGAAVSIPLRRDGMSRKKAFFLGQASGIVEPCACLLGYFLASSVQSALPFALSFSAGAMLAVVASELLPEANENKNFATIGCITGFIVMMILDVALG